MWRLDRMYPALKTEVPRLKKLPSEYILGNCYFSTQPIEEPDNRQHLIQMFEMLHAEKTVIFASDYPHWDFDNPLTVLSFLPQAMRRRIFVDNVVEFFGPRVLAPHG
jgi:predicted TIM-barrel fold metal-dependent hydrolase